MNLTKKQKGFIQDNIEKLTIKEITKELKIKRKVVEKYLSSLGIAPKPKIKKKNKSYATFKDLGDIKKFWLKHIDFFVLLAILIFIVYSTSMNGDFVSDDIKGYVEHPLTKDFWGSLKTLNLHKIIYAINYQLYGISSLPLHLTSVIMHIIIVILAFTAFAPFFSKKVLMIGTTIFALHPVNTESVSWISARGYLIAAIYIFLSIIFYNLYKQTKKNKYLIYVFVLLVLHIITTNTPKSLAVIPIIVIIDQFFYEKKIRLKKLIKFVPFVVISVTYLAIIMTRVQSRVATVTAPQINQQQKWTLIRVGYSFFKSSELLFFPKNLSLYQESEIITNPFKVIILINFIAIVTSIIYFWKKNRKIAGLILIGYASFFYVFSPVQIAWFIADRYLYIATLSFGLIVGMFFVWLEKKTKFKDIAIILTIILSLAYGIRGFVRNMDWKTRKSLWQATIKTDPNSYNAYNNLGDVYSKEGNYDMAIKSFSRAIQINPKYSDAIYNLGHTYLTISKLEEAETLFNKALKLNPNLYQAWFNLGYLEYEKGNINKAIDYMNKSLEINPGYEPAISAKQYIIEETK